MKTLTLAAIALAASTLAASTHAASAQQGHGMHGQMQQHHGQAQPPAKTDPHAGHGAAAPDASPSTKAYEAANDRMHKDMAIKFSGDADIDFFKGMIPHHQGAIDMAKVVLQHGKDPETKKMAEEIIAAQEKEIAFMREWLKKKGQ
ncbi:MAG: hypothetical protein FD175_2498 [Beijerinckiaceae bacterium]|nr:MAG: hypothetical protein FD175_2498 [Beijerinckiaceae bacterium]